MPVTSLWGSSDSMFGNELYGKWPFFVFPAALPFTPRFTSLLGSAYSEPRWMLYGQLAPYNFLGPTTSLVGMYQAWNGNIVPGMPIPSNTHGITINQSFVMNSSAKPGAIFLRAASNSVVYSIGIVYSPFILASNTLVLSQLVKVQGIWNRSPANTLTLTETLLPNAVFIRALNATLTMTETVSPSAILNRLCAQTFAMASRASPGAVLHLTLSQSLTYITLAEHPKPREVSNTLVLTGLASCAKTAHATASNILNILSVGSSIGVKHLAASNTLIYKSVFTRPTPLGVAFTVPAAVATVVPAKRICILQVYSNQSPRPIFGGPILGPSGVIVLPDPVLGDTLEPLGTVSIKYSINGTPSIIIKKSALVKFTYSFQLRRMKALELRQFIINNDTSLFLLTNWKGEVWFCSIVNSPLSLIAKSRWGEVCDNREQIDVALEFEGIKVGG